MMLKHLFTNLDNLYKSLFKKDSLIKVDKSIDYEVQVIMEKNNEIWLKHIDLYIQSFKEGEHKDRKYRTFNSFSLKRFNMALKELNNTLFSKEYKGEWANLFIHFLRSKIDLMRNFIETFANEKTFKKQRVINIVNLYYIWLSMINDDIKFLHKEHMQNIMSLNKSQLLESMVIDNMDFDELLKVMNEED